MSLINCPECGLEVSDNAISCPKCGYPFKKIASKKRNLFITSILLVILGIVGIGYTATFGLHVCRNYYYRGIELYGYKFVLQCLIFTTCVVLIYAGCRMLKKWLSHSIYIFWILTALSIGSWIYVFSMYGIYDPNSESEYTIDEYGRPIKRENLVDDDNANIDVDDTDIQVDAVKGGIKLKTDIRGITYEFDFFNDKTLKVIFTKGDDTLIYGGGWEDNSGSYHDVPYKWYELRYSFDGRRVLAIIDEDRNLYGPIDGDARIQIAQMIYIVHNDSSDPRYKDIIKYVSKLTEVE